MDQVMDGTNLEHSVQLLTLPMRRRFVNPKVSKGTTKRTRGMTLSTYKERLHWMETLLRS